MADESNFSDEEFDSGFGCSDSTMVTYSDTDINDLKKLKT